METWAILVAGGTGSRMGGTPKQFRLLEGRTVLERSLDVLVSVVDYVVVVAEPAAAQKVGITPNSSSIAAVVAGGETRTASVAAGLAYVPDAADLVLVHDAARPLATPDLVRRVIAAFDSESVDAAVPAIAVTDTIKVVDGSGVVVATPERSTLRAVQTPQGFRPDVLRAAHAAASGDSASDDAALVERNGGSVRIVRGDPQNFKLTQADDFHRAQRILAEQGEGT